jgi:hypothetical protein
MPSEEFHQRPNTQWFQALLHTLRVLRIKLCAPAMSDNVIQSDADVSMVWMAASHVQEQASSATHELQLLWSLAFVYGMCSGKTDTASDCGGLAVD